MYTIYDHNNNLFQLGLGSPKNTSILKAIIFHNTAKTYSYNNFYVIIFNAELEYSYDLRIHLKNKLAQYLFLHLFNTMFFLYNKVLFTKIFFNKYFKNIFNQFYKLNNHYLFSITIIFTKIFVILYIIFKYSSGSYINNINNSTQHTYTDLKSVISSINSKKRHKSILKNADLFFTSDIPTIKGINSFKLLPMQEINNNLSRDYSNIYLAADYRKIYKITNNNYLYTHPMHECIFENRKIFIFKINLNEQIIIFKKTDSINLNNREQYFIIPSKKTNNICNIFTDITRK